MQNDEVVKDIDIAVKLESASECSCDPEVGWVCERCFVISTLESAKRLLTQRAPDVRQVRHFFGRWFVPAAANASRWAASFPVFKIKTP